MIFIIIFEICAPQLTPSSKLRFVEPDNRLKTSSARLAPIDFPCYLKRLSRTVFVAGDLLNLFGRANVQ